YSLSLYQSPREMLNFLLTHTPTVTVSTLSLHDALPISSAASSWRVKLPPIDVRAHHPGQVGPVVVSHFAYWIGDESLKLSVGEPDRKSTRLNSSHVKISYDDFCLKKKKKKLRHKHKVRV